MLATTAHHPLTRPALVLAVLAPLLSCSAREPSLPGPPDGSRGRPLPPSRDGGQRGEGHPDRADAPPERESAGGSGSGRKLLFLGSDDRGLLLADSSASPLSVERIPLERDPLLRAEGGQAIYSTAFLDGGALVAAATKERVAVWSRASGELLGQRALPDLCRDQRERAVGQIVEGLRSNPFFHPDEPEPTRARLAAEEAERRCHEIIGPGIIVRSQTGGLAYDPWFDFSAVLGREDDAAGISWKLRTPLEVTGVQERSKTASPEKTWRSLTSDADELLGRSCVVIDSVANKTTIDPSARQWLTEGHTERLACVLRSETSVGSCYSAGGGLGSDPALRDASRRELSDTVRLCRQGSGGGGAYLLTSINYGMGNSPGPRLYVIDEGDRVIATTGHSATFWTSPRGAIFGGHDAWFVAATGTRPALLSLTIPDVITVACRGTGCDEATSSAY